MIATLSTPNTLYLSVYEGASGCAANGRLRLTDGTLAEDDALGMVGSDVWVLLDNALREAAIVGAKHVIVFTNAALLVTNLAGKRVRTPAPERTEQVYEPRKGGGGYVDYPVGGNEAWWGAIRGLVAYWCKGGSWQVIAVDAEQLKRAKELLESVGQS